MTLQQIKEALRNGQYAWPGGYPMYFLTSGGEALSFKAVRTNWRNICEAHIVRGYRDSGWFIEAVTINWEEPDLVCAETGEPIESAYAD